MIPRLLSPNGPSRASSAAGALLWLVAVPAAAQEAETGERARWLRDLEALDGGARETHAALFHTLEEQAWQEGIDRLADLAGTVSNEEMAIEIARLIARIGDGHTELWLGASDPPLGFRRIPVRLYPFDDGIRVQATRDEHAAIVGGHITHVGDTPIEDVLPQVRELLARDNEHYLERYCVVQTLNNFDVLRLLGLTHEDGTAELRVRHDGGETASARLRPAKTIEGLSTWGLEPRRDRLGEGWTFAVPEDAVPWLRRARAARPFELREMAGGTLVLDLDAVRDGQDETLAELALRTEEALSRPGVGRLVVDLRDNGGGNNQLDRPLLHAVLRAPHVDRPDRLFVLIDGHTFSAASHLVTLFELHTQATFVGSPTGASPNHFGDAEPVVLPESGMRVVFSRFFWQNSWPWDDRTATLPDVAVPLRWSDYVAGRDAALETALAAEPAPEDTRAAGLEDPGKRLVLDGDLSEPTWADARLLEGEGPGTVRLRRAADGTLHVGTRGSERGWVTVFVASEDEVSVLHASAALGTVRYRRDGSRWILEEPFAWVLRDASTTPQATADRQAHFAASGWVASTLAMGPSTDYEFSLSPALGERLAVVLSASSDTAWHAAPRKLEDSTTDPTLLGGDAPPVAVFEPEDWVPLE